MRGYTPLNSPEVDHICKIFDKGEINESVESAGVSLSVVSYDRIKKEGFNLLPKLYTLWAIDKANIHLPDLLLQIREMQSDHQTIFNRASELIEKFIFDDGQGENAAHDN